MRKEKFSSGSIFHVFNRSIAHFGIFKNSDNAQRFIEALDYYNNFEFKKKFSLARKEQEFNYQNLLLPRPTIYIKFLSYCIMPDHYHLLVKILVENYLSKFINDVGNSFTRFFNIKFERKGPLWESSFKVVRVRSDQQFLHLSRYIHLNPTTAGLVDRPEDWLFSSYRDIISDTCFLKEVLKEYSIDNVAAYKRFVEDNKDYQRKLKLIEKLSIE